MRIGDRIKELRERGNLTHAQLARKIGGRCSAATIANYEHHRVEISVPRARELVDALGLHDLAELFEGVE